MIHKKNSAHSQAVLGTLFFETYWCRCWPRPPPPAAARCQGATPPPPARSPTTAMSGWGGQIDEVATAVQNVDFQGAGHQGAQVKKHTPRAARCRCGGAHVAFRLCCSRCCCRRCGQWPCPPAGAPPRSRRGGMCACAGAARADRPPTPPCCCVPHLRIYPFLWNPFRPLRMVQRLPSASCVAGRRPRSERSCVPPGAMCRAWPLLGANSVQGELLF